MFAFYSPAEVQDAHDEARIDEGAAGSTVDDSTDLHAGSAPAQRKKVEAVQEWRTVADLLSQFPGVDPRQVNIVWSSQPSWSACVAVLNSIVTSHRHGVIPSSTTLSISEWPVLPQSSLRAASLPKDLVTLFPKAVSTDSMDRDLGSDWSLVHHTDGSEAMEMASVHSVDSWAMVEPNPKRDRAHSSAHSYREAVLRGAKRKEAEKKQQVVARASRGPWKPTILVSTAPVHRFHVDRLYVFSLPPPPSFLEEEVSSVEEEDIQWEVCCAGPGLYAQSVPAKRYNNTVRARPHVLEQRLKRLALN